MSINNVLNAHILFAIFCLLEPITSKSRDNAEFQRMESFTRRLGRTFFEYSNGVTKFKELRDKFSKDGEIQDVNPEQLFANVMRRVNESLQGKLDAIQKLAAYAEPKAFDHYSSSPDVKKPVRPNSYFNSKLINKPSSEDKPDESEPVPDDENAKFNCTFPTDLPLYKNEHFKTNVSMDVSSVHVPTSVYECDPELLHELAWSSDLEETFKNNYKQNPTLSWQYFGSSTGFMRQYPALKWPNDNEDKNSPDLYDCRFRPWYTASATSPKNLLILLDTSGSMTGMRRRIAKAVVNSILDTLTENDFFNVFTFSEETEVLVPCMNNTGNPILVQATLENIREFRVALEKTPTNGMADFEKALTKAFGSLNINQKENESADCNQAVMVVTDGAPKNFEVFFEEFNEKKKIRLFTYLVGKEVTDTAEVQWMACNNQGFFVQIFTLAEVQEKVLKYIPVMSRPLVMSQIREVMWTPVYASHAELVESEWLWESRTRKIQEERSERYVSYLHFVTGKKQNLTDKNFSKMRNDDERKELKNFFAYGFPNVTDKIIRAMEAEKERNIKFKRQQFKDFEIKQFNFVVTASFPVFDMRNFTNTSFSSKERIANFLGVVATDISIDELKELTSPFMLGVNGYAFAITNNGHIVIHPDFRPLYENILENILKPTYNSVDLTEIELVDRDSAYQERNQDEELLELRKDMLDKAGPQHSEKRVLPMRIHRDGFKRATTRNSVYVFGKIPGTTYILGIQVPPNSTTYNAEIEVNLLHRGFNILDNIFETYNTDMNETEKARFRNWKLHPDWTYCHYLTPQPEILEAKTKEDMFLHFIKRIQLQKFTKNMSWAWGSMAYGSGKVDREKKDDDSEYICNKKLVQSVIFDAMITRPLGESSRILGSEPIRRLVSNFGLGGELLNNGTLTAFVATRSGLTRWVDHPNARIHPTDLPFTQYHPRTIEESWYQRSVERAAIEEDSYVISVSFDAGTRSYSRVTATRAMLATKNGKKAPVAVIGIQYDLDSFLNFIGLLPKKGSRHDAKENICQDEDFHCFVLDENAFVIGSSKARDDAGRFFGEMDGSIMDILINYTIYKEVRVVDYQAVCAYPTINTSFASILTNPFRQLSILLKWFMGYMTSIILRLNFDMILRAPFSFGQEEDSFYYDDGDDGDEVDDRKMALKYASVSKTKLRPCDIEYKLYMYGEKYSVVGPITLYQKHGNRCDNLHCEDYLNVQRIPYTNLIMVILQANCHRCSNLRKYRKNIRGKEVVYQLYDKFGNKTNITDNPVMSEICRMPSRPLYRKRLFHCHNYAKDEFIMKKDCGGASLNKGSLATILIMTIFSMIKFKLCFKFDSLNN